MRTNGEKKWRKDPFLIEQSEFLHLSIKSHFYPCSKSSEHIKKRLESEKWKREMSGKEMVMMLKCTNTQRANYLLHWNYPEIAIRKFEYKFRQQSYGVWVKFICKRRHQCENIKRVPISSTGTIEVETRNHKDHQQTCAQANKNKKRFNFF